jgi:hypothetical protein
METLYTFAFQEPNWDRVKKRLPKISSDQNKILSDKLSFQYDLGETMKNVSRQTNTDIRPKARQIDTDSAQRVRETINKIKPPTPQPKAQPIPQPPTQTKVASSTSKAKYVKKSPYWTKKKMGLLAGGVLGAGAIGLGTKMYLDRRNKKR